MDPNIWNIDQMGESYPTQAVMGKTKEGYALILKSHINVLPWEVKDQVDKEYCMVFLLFGFYLKPCIHAMLVVYALIKADFLPLRWWSLSGYI